MILNCSACLLRGEVDKQVSNLGIIFIITLFDNQWPGFSVGESKRYSDLRRHTLNLD